MLSLSLSVTMLVSVLRMCVTCWLFRWQPRPPWPGVWCGMLAARLNPCPEQVRTATRVCSWPLKSRGGWSFQHRVKATNGGRLRSRARSSCRSPATGDVRASGAGDRADGVALSVAANVNVTWGTAGRVAITATNSSSRPAGRSVRGRGERRHVAVAVAAAPAPAGRESLPLLNRESSALCSDQERFRASQAQMLNWLMMFKRNIPCLTISGWWWIPAAFQQNSQWRRHFLSSC